MFFICRRSLADQFGLKAALRWTWLSFLPTALIILFVLYYAMHVEMDSYKKSIVSREVEVQRLEASRLLLLLEEGKKDLHFLTTFPGVQNFLEGSTLDYDTISKTLKAFGESQKFYDQVRIFDARGMEKIRVNFKDSQGTITPISLLQNKADRYYVREAFLLEPGEIYISPFDLNVEHGKVEIPYKPMIRLVMPIYSSEGEDLLGLGALNFLGEMFLSALGSHEKDKAFKDPLKIWIVNSDGYWFRGPSKEIEWGFMFPEKKEVSSFAEEYPGVWSAIKKNFSGSMAEKDRFFVFSPVNIYYGQKDSLQRTWYIISVLPENVFWSRGLFLRWISLSLSLLALLWGALFYGISRFLLSRKEALLDPLTEGYNRHSMLKFLSKGEKKKAPRPCCVVLVDMGNFKMVNDQCGHDAGDEALQLTAKIMREGLRGTDRVGRYGGDEFLVYLPGVGSAVGESVMQRIGKKIRETELPCSSDLFLVADYGIVEFPTEAASMEEAIALADKRMYENKKSRKAREGIVGR